MRAEVAAWLVLSLLGGTGAEDTCGDPPAAPSRSIPAPQLSPEELLSPHMPQSLRCDACHAIAFQSLGVRMSPRTECPGGVPRDSGVPSDHFASARPLPAVTGCWSWPARSGCRGRGCGRSSP
uniref:Marginal zone B and B1 cell specific protein n=1 Tax=Taeniopygia guttata TaxID=59729 RepID=A0A674GHZ1_TAEGU